MNIDPLGNHNKLQNKGVPVSTDRTDEISDSAWNQIIGHLEKNYDLDNTNIMSPLDPDFRELIKKADVLIFAENHLVKSDLENFGEIVNLLSGNFKNVKLLTESVPYIGKGQLQFVSPDVTATARRWDTTTPLQGELENVQYLFHVAELILQIPETKLEDLSKKLDNIFQTLTTVLTRIKGDDVLLTLRKTQGEIDENVASFNKLTGFDLPGFKKYLISKICPLFSQAYNTEAKFIKQANEQTFLARQNSFFEHIKNEKEGFINSGGEPPLILSICGRHHALGNEKNPYKHGVESFIAKLIQNDIKYAVFAPQSQNGNSSLRIGNIETDAVKQPIKSSMPTMKNTVSRLSESSPQKLTKQAEKIKSCREKLQDYKENKTISFAEAAQLLVEYSEEVSKLANSSAGERAHQPKNSLYSFFASWLPK